MERGDFPSSLLLVGFNCTIFYDDLQSAHYPQVQPGFLTNILPPSPSPCSVVFNFLGRDFFNALSEKNAELFTLQLFKYLGGFALGIPVFVYRSYCQVSLQICFSLQI